jgi:hypothetical protein
MRRLATALGATAVIFVLVGCGGLGVNIGSGTSRGSQVVNLVSIQVQSGPNVPQVERGHPIQFTGIAYYTFGSQNYVSATQGAVWTTPKIVCEDVFFCGDIIRFMDPQCTHVLTGFVGTDPTASWIAPDQPGTSQTACVLGVNPGSATLFATVKGVTGKITVTVL